jgi:RNA-directed DNA polymerase
MEPALSENLMEAVLESANVRQAWKRVKSNGGAAGVDGTTVYEFVDTIRTSWAGIRESLMNGTYQPSPVLRVEIPKKSGGKRPLGIPTVCDRLIQQSVQQVLTPEFDPKFSESSYGFRPNRSAHGAVRKVQQLIRNDYRFVVDIDIEKFFDRVDHDILMMLISRQVSDKRVLRLIGSYLRSGVKVDGKLEPTQKGTPQGGPLSPLLANIYLDVLDKELEKRGLNFVRYADDLLILVKSQSAGDRVLQSVTRFLEKRLKLTVNQKKSGVRKVDDMNYLGFRFTREGKILWTDESYRGFRQRVKELTARSWGVSMRYRLSQLSMYIRGWVNYFGISEYYRPVPELDAWIRRRVRMCAIKVWRRCRTRIRNLNAMGVLLNTAIRTGCIERGWWYLSSVLGVQNAFTNKWLKEHGLVSVKELWCKIHYGDKVRTKLASR